MKSCSRQICNLAEQPSHNMAVGERLYLLVIQGRHFFQNTTKIRSPAVEQNCDYQKHFGIRVLISDCFISFR